MWRVIWFLLGLSRLSVTGVSPEWCLQRLAKQRLAFHVCGRPDAFTIDIWVLRCDEARAQRLIESGGCTAVVVERSGFSTVFGGLRKRPVLLALVALAIAAAIVVPKFVFFYTVEGNESVPEALILRQLQELGVGFGTYGPSIKPQELKNQMLLRIPKLQWLTVQQSGMCACVVVRERPEKEEILDRRTPTNVVAARAGVITRVQAETGNCLCSPGQAVQAGELLVSAYTDFGFKTQVSAARAEIYAQTVRMEQCVLPQSQQRKTTRAAPRYVLSVCIGRRRITLGSGTQAEATCEKQTKSIQISLPGGFSLPLGIEITRICEYDTREEELREMEAEERLLAAVQAEAKRDMIAGTIEDTSFRLRKDADCFRLSVRLQCEEMIARIQPANLKEAIS